MNITQLIGCAGLTCALMASNAIAGVVDPDCTAEKAAKSAATKATVGVGGRCSAGEAAKDTGKKAAGVEEKGPIEKQKKKNDTPAEKAKDAVTK
jgi:hypothetical protein